MLEHYIELFLPEIVSILEIMGIIVISVGCLKAFYHYMKAYLTNKNYPLRIELANALALGLEFKLGAEILKTVLVRSMNEIFILGAIILLRALLSLMIHFEIKAENSHASGEHSANDY